MLALSTSVPAPPEHKGDKDAAGDKNVGNVEDRKVNERRGKEVRDGTQGHAVDGVSDAAPATQATIARSESGTSRRRQATQRPTPQITAATSTKTRPAPSPSEKAAPVL